MTDRPHLRGKGNLTVAQTETAMAMLQGGMTQQAVADGFGVTKNTIAGLWARAGLGSPTHDAETTLFDRLDALHARLDAVLAETRDIGRLPNLPKR